MNSKNTDTTRNLHQCHVIFDFHIYVFEILQNQVLSGVLIKVKNWL